jgi:hypothetical protein
MIACLACAHAVPRAAAPERIEVTPDGSGFRLAPSGRPFTPWGFNYDRDDQGRLLEDYWDADWPRVEQDFGEMKALGATVVRIHLQVARFMRAPDRADEQALGRLGRLLDLAARTGLYLDLTGLGSYRRADVPRWYLDSTEEQRWAAQARFWDAVAARCAPHPAVFAYNLMNEPVSPGGPVKDWVAGSLAGFDYVEFITRDPRGRSRVEVARRWLATLIPAIRRHDPRRPITVGMFYLDGRGALSLGERAGELARDLDHVSIHIYPTEAQAGDAAALLTPVAVGKPIVIEETYPFNCSAPALARFLDGSRGHAAGWIGFYWGKTLDEATRSALPRDAVLASWLRLFRDAGVRFRAVP